MQHMIDSGIFDKDWYLKRNSDIANSGQDPLFHWLTNYLTEARNPCYLFDTRGYIKANSIDDCDTDPITHYLGNSHQVDISTSLYFDHNWYRIEYNEALQKQGVSPLQHFLENERSGQVSPNQFFDTSFYLRAYPDIAEAGIRPYLHFLETGVHEGRNPSSTFDTNFYRKKHRLDPSIDPFTHYITVGFRDNYITNKDSDVTVYSQALTNTQPGPWFRSALQANEGTEFLPRKDVDLFAYYLPQFHPLDVNDAAWGTGFTEWTNVPRGLPRFGGHVQPRLPRDLGYYDLRNAEVIQDQVHLAKSAGLTGFCFYYYNFSGEILMDLPIESFSKVETEFKFFLLWANENWTKTWDGFDKEVIKKQTYELSEMTAMVADVATHMKRPNYYRLDNRPVFIIYRPGVIPNAAEYINLLRKEFRIQSGLNPVIFMAQGFGNLNPTAFGLDGAIEFPPHKLAQDLVKINDTLDFFDDSYAGSVISYDSIVERSVAEAAPPFPLIKTLIPSWDNEARRPGRGTIIHGSNPNKFGKWLSQIIEKAQKNPIFGRPIVAINAWNEWCEGAILEPDVHFGHAYLQATYDALHGVAPLESTSHILLIGHDAHKHGAQILLKYLGIQLKHLGYRVSIIILAGGALEDEYRKISDTFWVASNASHFKQILTSSHFDDCNKAITNTTVCGDIVPFLKARKFAVVSLVHEMARTISEYNLSSQARNIATHSDKIVFPATVVMEQFISRVETRNDRMTIFPQGIYRADLSSCNVIFPQREKIICNIGYGDLRKGYDAFVSVARTAEKYHPELEFVWIGNLDYNLNSWLAPLPKNLRNVPFAEDIAFISRDFDLLLLTSREDPFPSTALEALVCGLPVVALAGSGGIADMLQEEPKFGSLVQHDALPPAVLSAVVGELDRDSLERRRDRSRLSVERFCFADYVTGLLGFCGEVRPDVTAVVPNYNYSRYISERVSSLTDQSFKCNKLVLLDDFSTDDSTNVLTNVSRTLSPWAICKFNYANSGNTFAQWNAGLRLCNSKYTWIAEADDLAAPDFLELMIPLMEKSNAFFGFCNSSQIDQDDSLLSGDYNYYYDEIDSDLFSESFVISGNDFIRRGLSVKNPILNVSSVLWRTDVLKQLLNSHLDRVISYRVCGDWFLYLLAAATAESTVCYIKEPLNVHRRHSGSVTHSQKRADQLAEIRSIHNFVFSLVPSVGESEELRMKQADYLKELRIQFGI